MSFNENKRLDTSQVQDRRGGRRTGRKIAVGGGGFGIVAILLYMLLGGNPADLAESEVFSQPSSGGYYENVNDVETECLTGADANHRQDCQLVGFVNSVQAFWVDELPDYGMEYVPAQTVLFSGSTQGACGFASSASGPFYCPRDQMIYVDLSFFETIQSR